MNELNLYISDGEEALCALGEILLEEGSEALHGLFVERVIIWIEIIDFKLK